MEEIRKKRGAYNLADYETACRKFQWLDAKKEIVWFNGKTNAAYNAVDRHAEGPEKNKPAILWEGENNERRQYSFLELSRQSNRFANVMKKLGVKKGDRVFIFLPRIPELFIAFLGTLKIGAIAGTLFAAFGSSAIKDRLGDSGAKILITDTELVKRVYHVKAELPKLEKVVVVGKKKLKKYEVSYEKEMEKSSDCFRTKMLGPEAPAFMIYTSGTTGRPKGVVHAHAAIMQQHLTAKWVLDLKKGDVYWTTADPGWVTGIAYGILGNLSNKATTLVYAGRFDAKKWYSLISRHGVTVWYTAPTAVRMMMQQEKPKQKLKSLRHLCSVGEPLNPEAIKWGMKALGLAFHDNWWQTETGSILIANYPSMNIRPGSMGRPVPGIKAAIIDDSGKILGKGKEGSLAIKPKWPSMMRKIWKNKKKYNEYFKKGWFVTGDRASIDKNGYFWFVGRADDVIKTSGERVGPFEVESALMEHKAVAEAAVIGKPDALRGEIIKAFIVLKKGSNPSKNLEEKLKSFVKKHLAGHAYPREMSFVDSLPKTRSGKIMRRLLRAKEAGQPLGDTSTLEEY